MRFATLSLVGSVALASASFGAVTLRCEPAFAQNAAGAEKAYNEGKALFDAGKFDDACPKLQLSDKLDPANGTKLLLATCFERQDKLASAYNLYVAVEPLYRTAGKTERADFAKARYKELEPKLPTLQVDAKEKPADLRLKLDGNDYLVEALGTALPVDKGPHLLVASASGKKVFQANVTAASKGVTKIEIVFESAPSDYVPPVGVGVIAPPGQKTQIITTEGDTTKRTVGWILVAGGGGLAIGGVIAQIVSLNQNSQAKALGNCAVANHATGFGGGAISYPAEFAKNDIQFERCPAGVLTQTTNLFAMNIAYNSKSNAAKADQAAAIGLFAGGAVAAAVGIYLILSAAPTKKEITERNAGIHVTPVFGGDRVGVIGTF